jgi:hypothetical protein
LSGSLNLVENHEFIPFSGVSLNLYLHACTHLYLLEPLS